MTYRGPYPLTDEHELRGFDCGKPALDWLVRRELTNQSTGTSRTSVITTTDEARAVALYASEPPWV